MKLQEWCNKAEDTRSKLADEYFNMQVALPFSKEKIEELEKINSELAKHFLKHFKEPKLIYHDAIASQLSHKLSKIYLEFTETRKTKVSMKKVKFNGETLNWTNWRQFAVKSDSETRKRVFDKFIENTKYITPIIEENFSIYKKVYKEQNIDVLEPYFYQHKIDFNKLKDVVDKLGSSLKNKFVKQFNYYSNEINNRDGEYYDDFYFMRNAVFNNLKITNKFDILKSIKKKARGERAWPYYTDTLWLKRLS